VTIIKTYILLIQFLTVPDTSNFIVDIKFTEIKVTVRINPKRPNHNYPSCHLVGRHLTLRLLMYVNGAPSKARNANVVYTGVTGGTDLTSGECSLC